MSSTQSLVAQIKRELRTRGLTYADVARTLGLSESSVKRMLAPGGDMPLSRVDTLCQLLELDFAELMRRMTQQSSVRRELSLDQERSVVADPRRLLMAICCLSQWSVEQILDRYQFSEAEVVRHLVELDRLGIVELRPLNRYRLLVAKTFRWRPHGPVMQYFRDHVMHDFFAGGFAGDAERLTLVHGELGQAMARELVDRLQRVAEDFARQHLADQRLQPSERRPYSLLIGMRSWLFEPFQHLQRRQPRPASTPDADED